MKPQEKLNKAARAHGWANWSEVLMHNAPSHVINLIVEEAMRGDESKKQNVELAVVLIEQLDKWIEGCQAEADVFFERGMVVSETSSLAMKVAYMNVKTLVENNR